MKNLLRIATSVLKTVIYVRMNIDEVVVNLVRDFVWVSYNIAVQGFFLLC